MELTHFNDKGLPRMVDVSGKEITVRTAEASARVLMAAETLVMIRDGASKKGDVLAAAQIAGITGAKKTSDLIPMCHNILISGADIDFRLTESDGRGIVEITATVKTSGQTGIEMEAMTAVSAAALTIYDMCKAVDRGMEITDIKLLKKTGGRSGAWERG